VTGDDELIALAKRGDGESWRALYRAHAGRLLVWLSTRPTGDTSETADDLAAQAWLTAAERIHTFTGTSDEFAGWLFGIARKHGANTHRRGQRRQTHPADLGLADSVGALPVVPGPEPAAAAQDWVVRALSVLPDRERDVVGCREVVGLDVAGTAEALGISAVAVRVAHHRGLRRLRSVLEGPPGQDGSSARSLSR
jgi:RNA polymerase sigma-70 factor (ECF subfamily)